MNDFVNQFWNWYVILLVLVSIIACGVLLWTQSTPPAAGQARYHRPRLGRNP
jgi:cytochrome c oxidase cbb3-type subunit 3